MDYGLEPPEINSGRMYAGVGSASLMASAAAWQSLAAELGIAAGSFDSMVSAMAASSWLGPSALSMLSSALPFVTWMMTTAAQCEQAALSATQAASSFETARAAVIPPPMIAENRVRLATLVATNFMGVNSAAIAATEAEYEEFWAQDATTMYGFASEAAGITGSMIPFIPAMPTTNPAGLAAQAASVGEAAGQSAGQVSSQVGTATSNMAAMPAGMGSAASMMGMAPQAMGMIPQALQGLTSPLSSLTSPLSSAASSLQSLFGPMMSMLNPGMLSGIGSGLGGGLGGLNSSLSSLGSLGSPSGVGGMPMAAMGRAASLSGSTKLSVPSSWATQTQAQTKMVAPLEEPLADAAPQGAVMPPRAPLVPAAAASGGGSNSAIPTNMMGDLGKRPHEGRSPSLPNIYARVTPPSRWN